MRRLPFLLTFALACVDATAPPNGPSDPIAAQFISSDLTNFWTAYDAGGRDGVSAAFERLYLGRASPGLRDFIGRRNLTASSLAAMVTAYPRYFAAIRATTLQLTTESAVIGRIRAGYARIKEEYPASVFPPVTLLIGQFSTGGTTSSSGMLIGSEFYSIAPGTPLDELGEFQRNNAKPLDSLPLIVAHEHVHILQERAGGIFTHQSKSLLELTLMEGSADFVGAMVSGGNINARLWTYALPREKSLWTEFRASMHGTDASRWLYNQADANADRPGDLGYFIGYRITESFYQRAAGKRAALREIIEMGDANDFLTRSGYSP